MLLHEWQLALQDAALGISDRVSLALKRDSTPPSIGLGIYANAYSSRLEEALRSNFPALHHLLGDDEFKTIAARYLANHPSQHSSIRWFGEHLARFLGEVEPYRSTPVMHELAAFEWAIRHTIDAAGAVRTEFQEMTALAPREWGALRFSLHPSLTILDLEWNVLPIWHALTNRTVPPTPCPAPQCCLVWRQRDFISAWRSCDFFEATALRALGAGATVAELCESPALHRNEVALIPERVAGLIRNGVDGGFLCHYTDRR